MNEIVINFSFPGDKFMPEMHLRQPAIGIFSKYAWLILLKDKKGITITNAFQKILGESNCKPNKIWVVKAANFIIDQ